MPTNDALDSGETVEDRMRGALFAVYSRYKDAVELNLIRPSALSKAQATEAMLALNECYPADRLYRQLLADLEAPADAHE
jgi:hypothetical protein